MIDLIMPMAGAGARFFADGIVQPKPLIEIHGRPFFYWSAESISRFVKLRSITFVILRRHAEEYGLDRAILKYYPGTRLVFLNDVLNGAVLTCLEGVRELAGGDIPVVFNDCDHAFRATSFYDYCNAGQNFDHGALLTFESREPKYSFAELTTEGLVSRTVEKQAVSSEAICGAYFFKNRDIFIEAATKYLDNCDYSEYFMSGVYNILCAEGRRVRPFRVDWHIPFGTPEEYLLAEKSTRFGL